LLREKLLAAGDLYGRLKNHCYRPTCCQTAMMMELE
jgi:hypothetical protein